jgi:putative aldouronate transport system permease protein
VTIFKPPVGNPKTRRGIPEKYALFLMLLPFLAIVFIFSYLPLTGWQYAFYSFRPGFTLSQSKYVGWYWFQSIFANSIQVNEITRVMINTLAISGLGLLVSCIAPVFAILLNEIRHKKYRKGVQVLTTLPNFISWVLVYAVAFALFNVGNGMVNQILVGLGLTKAPINFLASDKHVWLTMMLWSMWKGLGWSAIMYLAAIAGIDQELYEAAKVDGAGRFSQVIHVTLPGIAPTFLVLLVLSIANLLNNGMDQYYVFQNSMNKTSIEVLDLYVYNISILGGSFSFGTAVSMMKSIISLTLLLAANGAAKLIRGTSIF